MYVYIVDNEIKDVFCGEIPVTYSRRCIKEVSDNLSFPYKDVRAYNSNYTIKPVTELVSLGILTLSPSQKLEGDRIVDKTDLEMYLEGTKKVPDGFKFDGTNLIEMTMEEKHSAGLITDVEYRDYQIAQCQSYLDSTDWYVTRLMERQVAIPDDVKAQRLDMIERINTLKKRGEATKEEWLAKVEEIRLRYPKRGSDAST